MKKDLSQIFKNGENFQFSQIDYSSPKITKEIEILKKKQNEIIESSKVDLNELRKFIFTI